MNGMIFMKKKPIIGLMIGNVNKNFSDEIVKGVLKYTDENNISTVMLLSSPIFDDEDGVMNKSILDVDGSILSISQFTLYADPYKGNRPSYVNAMGGDEAIKLYKKIEKMKKII